MTRTKYVPPRIENYVARIQSQYKQNPHLGYAFHCACGHQFEAWDFGNPYSEDRANRAWNHHASSKVSRTAMQRVGLSAWRRVSPETAALDNQGKESMAIKETILKAGVVLGAVLIAIPLVAAPEPTLFALPRDAASLADFQTRLTVGNCTALAGLVTLFGCLAMILRRACRKG